MKRLISMLVMLGMMVFNASAVERITVDDVFNHYPWDGKVDCVFTLSGLESGCVYKGNFTISVKKDAAVQRRVVTKTFSSGAGTYTNTFDCASLFGTGFYPVGGIAVDLVKTTSGTPPDATGTPIGIIGDVLIIDIAGGTSALTYPTKEFSGVDLGTFNCDIYKTDRIVLRKVPAGDYYCQPRNWNASDADAVVTQRLATRGFFIGVFPITQRQYERVMGTNPSDYKTDSSGNLAAHRPIDHVSWDTIRGRELVGSPITVLSPDSFLQRLAVKTGFSGFDLPTEAQWEIACRAGSTAAYGAYWNGLSAVDLILSNIGEVAWYEDNSSDTTWAVGGKLPNLWGLYDMQGNAFEWCRDNYAATYNSSYVDEPCMETSYYSGVYRVMRGGVWYRSADYYCRPSHRSGQRLDDSSGTIGFRLSKSLP